MTTAFHRGLDQVRLEQMQAGDEADTRNDLAMFRPLRSANSAIGHTIASALRPAVLAHEKAELLDLTRATPLDPLDRIRDGLSALIAQCEREFPGYEHDGVEQVMKSLRAARMDIELVGLAHGEDRGWNV